MTLVQCRRFFSFYPTSQPIKENNEGDPPGNPFLEDGDHGNPFLEDDDHGNPFIEDGDDQRNPFSEERSVVLAWRSADSVSAGL